MERKAGVEIRPCAPCDGEHGGTQPSPTVSGSARRQETLPVAMSRGAKSERTSLTPRAPSHIDSGTRNATDAKCRTAVAAKYRKANA